MAIKMRNNRNEDAICCECGDTQKEVLNMYDLCIGGVITTLCDICNRELFNKTLHAEVMKNKRDKSERDMKIIAIRESKGIW